MKQTQQQEQARAKKPAPKVQPPLQNTALSTRALSAIQRQEAPAPQLHPADVMALQRTVGNQSVQRLLKGQPQPSPSNPAAAMIQPKLEVGAANDKYEQEADRVARQVTGNGRPTVQRTLSLNKVQRQAGPEDSFKAGGDFEAHLRRTQGSGTPLPDATRNEFESKFGSSFEGVRIHANAESNQLNRSIQAKAFTHGNDIHFASGQYNPTSSDGKRLLAHELTHTIQQTGGQSLQRTPGDLALGSNLSLSSTPSIQRKLNFEATELGGKLSKTAKFKGFFGKTSTYAKIQMELANYAKADGPGEELASLTILKQLVGQWQKNHLADKDNVKEKSITRLLLEIETEMPQVQQRIRDDAQEQEDYVRSLESKGLKYLSSGGVHIYKKMKGWHAGTDTLGTQAGKVHEIGQKYGLTLAEVSAIGIYTADDYKYMNPAMAGNRGWMKAMLPRVGMTNFKTVEEISKGVTDTHIDEAMTEGRLHGKIAKSAMKKLPNWTGTAYRGLGLTEKDFAAQYPLNGVTVFPAFSSTSLEERISKGFAKNEATGDKVGVLLRLHVTKGKDVAPLSNSPGEQEVLLMPGATFRISRIRTDQYKGVKLYVLDLRQEK
jgi:hypothetical protein